MFFFNPKDYKVTSSWLAKAVEMDYQTCFLALNLTAGGLKK